MTTVNTEINATKESAVKKWTLEEMLKLSTYRNLDPVFMAARIDFIYKHDEVSDDLKQTINYVIDEEASEAGLSFSDDDTIRHYFPVIVKALRQKRGDDDAFDFLHSLNRLFWMTPTFNGTDFQKHEITRLAEESFILRALSLAKSEAESNPAFAQGLVNLLAEHYPAYRTSEQTQALETLTGFAPETKAVGKVAAIKPRGSSKLPKAA